MCKPHIRTDPPHFLHVSYRTMAEFLQAELFLVLGLSQVGMQMDAILARQLGRLLHQFAGHAER